MTPHQKIEPIRHDAMPIESGLLIQDQGLRALLAEMYALAALLPGRPGHHLTDAEIEENFDNMPV